MSSATKARASLRRRLGFDHSARMTAKAIEAIRPLRTRPMRVLEAGCGNGQLLAHLSNHRWLSRAERRTVELWGFDVSETAPAVERLTGLLPEERWEERIRTGNSDRWPFQDNYFDIVISNQVLEHVKDMTKFLDECRRTLRPDGVAIHIFPTCRMIVEPHLLVPLVHWLKTDVARTRLLRALYRLGLKKSGFRVPRNPAADMRYLRGSTHYRTWQDISDTAASVRLRCVPRHSFGYLTSAFRRRSLSGAHLGPRRSRLLDYASVAVAQWFFSVTLVMWPTRIDAPKQACQ